MKGGPPLSVFVASALALASRRALLALRARRRRVVMHVALGVAILARLQGPVFRAAAAVLL